MSKNPTDAAKPATSQPQGAAATIAAPPPTARKTADFLKQLEDLIRSADHDTQQALKRLGTVLPVGDVKAALEGRFKFGLRCQKCNQVALYFVGDQFLDLNNNEQYDRPQPHMKISELTWTQNLPADEIDRRDPRCQCCKAFVEKEGTDRFRFSRTGSPASLVVEVDEFVRTRDASYDKKNLQAFKRLVDKMGDSYVTNEKGESVSIKDFLNGKQIEKISDVIKQLNPDGFKEMQEVDAQLHQAGHGGLLGLLRKMGA